MFQFDDRYIIFVILSPGIFTIGLIYILLNLCGVPILSISFNNSLIDFGFGAIISLVIGCILWYANHKGHFVDKYRLKKILNEIEDETLLEALGMTLEELKEKFKVDFKKEFIPHKGKSQLKEFHSNFTDIYYGLNRVIGLKTPSAVKLLREFLEQIIVSIKLLLIPSFLVLIYLIMEYDWQTNTIITFVVSVTLVLLSLLLHKALQAKDRRFYIALLDVYTANHYWDVITKDLKRK